MFRKPFMTITKASFLGPRVLAKPATVDALLSLLEEHGWEPLKWSVNERGGVPYSREDVVDAIASGRLGVYLQRSRVPKYSSSIGNSCLSGTMSLLVVEPSGMNATWHARFWELVDACASLVKPDISSAQAIPADRIPLPEECGTDDALELMLLGHSWQTAAGYTQYAIKGLACRTYLGPKYVEQFGRGRLLSTPAAVTETDWGAIRIDLHPEPWNAPLAELLATRRAAMAHLRPAGVFASYEITPEPHSARSNIDYTKGPNCVVPSYPREER